MKPLYAIVTESGTSRFLRDTMPGSVFAISWLGDSVLGHKEAIAHVYDPRHVNDAGFHQVWSLGIGDWTALDTDGIWDFPKAPELEIIAMGKAAYRSMIFDKLVAPGAHWKDPINAWIADSEFAECERACEWYCATELEVKRVVGGMLHVTSRGYCG